jgi:D-amino-acid dehydrogenase
MSSSSAVVSSAPPSPITWPRPDTRSRWWTASRPGLETSFANAGEVSPGYSAPWAGPGVPLKAIKWMLMHHSPLVIKPMLDPAMWRWGMAMLRNCTEAAYQVNKSRMVRVAEYSRDCLKQLRAETGITYDERTQGTCSFSVPRSSSTASARMSRSCKQSGVPFQVLDREGYLAYEPALALVKTSSSVPCACPATRPAIASSSPASWPPWPRPWACSFRFGVSITGIDHDGQRITGVRSDAGTLRPTITCWPWAAIPPRC